MLRSVQVVVVLLVGLLLGGTVLRDEIADAAQGTPFQNVIVANDATRPVPVREQNVDAAGAVRVTSADDPHRAAFGFFKHQSWSSSDSQHVSFTVPEGKRLVIESVSVQASLPTGQQLVAAAVQAHVNGAFQDYFLAPVPTGPTSSGNSDLFIASQSGVIAFADSGTEVKVFGVRNAVGSDNARLNVSVQGYFLDCTTRPCG